MGNTQVGGMSLCCNNAYINKNHEIIAPEFNAAHRVKMQEKLNKKEVADLKRERQGSNLGGYEDKENDIIDDYNNKDGMKQHL